MDPAPAGVFSGHSLVRLYIWVQRHAGRSGGPVFVGANPCIRPDTFQIEQFPQTTGKLFYCVNIGSSVTPASSRRRFLQRHLLHSDSCTGFDYLLAIHLEIF